MWKLRGGMLLAAVLLGAGCGQLADDGGLGDGGQLPGGQLPGGQLPGGNGNTGGTDSNGIPNVAPVITSGTVRVMGRWGTDLRISLVGVDPNKDAQTLTVAYADISGNPVLIFDNNFDGNVDSASGTQGLDNVIEGAAEFTAVATLPRFVTDHPTVAKVTVQLHDANNGASEALTLNVSEQPEVALGGLCDKTYADNRCATGLGCKGNPTVCAAGEAPTLPAAPGNLNTQVVGVAYVQSSAGPRVVVLGTDNDDDVSRVRIDFLDSGNNPVGFDFDGDPSTPQETGLDFGEDTIRQLGDGQFFVAMQAADGFETSVPRVSVTAHDRAGRVSSTRVANHRAQPAVGSSCSPLGFNKCNTGSICIERTPTTGSCASVTTTRNQQCSAATALTPASGASVSVVGQADGPSLWDPPAGCSNSAGDRPEGIARVRIPAGASKVAFSTSNPGTSFDTILYVYPGCTGTVLGCNDDAPNTGASVVELSNPAPGDYLVVVDAWGPTGGTFELTATLQ